MLHTKRGNSNSWITRLDYRITALCEGFTDNLQETLNKHSAATVATYGIRQSHTSNSSKVNKENKILRLEYLIRVGYARLSFITQWVDLLVPKLFWTKTDGDKDYSV